MKVLLATLSLVSLAVKESLAFQIISTCKSAHKIQHQIYSTPANSNDENEPQELIIGESLSQGLQSIASEAGYLAAARKRNEEAKAKMLEQIRLEEEAAERIRKDRELNGPVNNAGPADMSSWVGFKDDGFETSAGQDSSAWGENPQSDIQIAGQEGQEQGQGDDSGDEPKLFLFGDEGQGDNGTGLIL